MDEFDEHADQKKIIDDRNKRRRDRELADLKKILAIVEGRRVVWRLLSEAGIFRSAFNTNALQMSFNTGNQNLGYLLWNDLNVVSPERYAQMQREYVSDLKSEGAKQN